MEQTAPQVDFLIIILNYSTNLSFNLLKLSDVLAQMCAWTMEIVFLNPTVIHVSANQATQVPDVNPVNTHLYSKKGFFSFLILFINIKATLAQPDPVVTVPHATCSMG